MLFASLAALGAAALLWYVKRDRRYLRFIGLTLQFTLVMLLAVLLWFAAERLLAPASRLPSDASHSKIDAAPIRAGTRPA